MYCDLKINEILKRYDKKLIEAINLNKSQLSLLIETFNIFTICSLSAQKGYLHIYCSYYMKKKEETENIISKFPAIHSRCTVRDLKCLLN